MSTHPFKNTDDQEQFSKELDSLLESWLPRFAESPHLQDNILDGYDPHQPHITDGWVLCFSIRNMDNWMRVFTIKRDGLDLFKTRGMADYLHDWAVDLMD